MSRFLENIWGGIQILINPRYLKNKMDAINRQIDETSAMNIVGKAQIKELRRFAEKYPNDEMLNEKVDFIDNLPKEDKEDITDLVNMKKEIINTPVQTCNSCQQNYIYSCNHIKGGA